MNRNAIAIITENRQMSYGQLETEVNQLAERLTARTVALLVMENELSSVLCYLACMKRGVVPLLLDADTEVSELREYVRLYAPYYIMLPGGFSEAVLFDSYQRMEENENVWICKRAGQQVKSGELALLLTTSGTTGVSKLVRISRDNLRCNTESICEYLEMDETSRAISVLPFSYTYGLSVLHTHLYAGASLLLTKRSVLQKEFWNFFAANEGTSLSGVPFTYDLMEKSGFLKRHYPSLNTMTQSGGKLPVSLQKKYGEYASQHGIRLYLMYGQTEATARISYLPPQDIFRKPGSVGIAIPGGRIQIEKTSQEEGEIVYSGGNVTMGYAVCREDLDRGDVNHGVLHTGDIGYQDEEGYLYITGRKAAFAKIYGRRINLKELEEQIRERWGIYVCCKEHEQKIWVEYETASQEEISLVLEWLSQRTKLGKHCFVPDRRKRRWK